MMRYHWLTLLAYALAAARAGSAPSPDNCRARPKERRYLLVDITRYEIALVDEGRALFESKAIVGSKKTPTPCLRTEVTGIGFNPWWILPKSIAVREVLPWVQQDSEYLSRHGIRVVRRTQKGPQVLAPRSLAWHQMGPSHFPVVLEQSPGPTNPLGALKLLMPNPYLVTVHATTEPELYQAARRAFSHGCVRVEKALELAWVLIARTKTRAPIEELKRRAAAGETFSVPLATKIPIYFARGLPTDEAPEITQAE